MQHHAIKNLQLPVTNQLPKRENIKQLNLYKALKL